MAVRAPGDFPPDNSGAPPFEDNVDIPGQFKGGGQGFGGGDTDYTPGWEGKFTNPRWPFIGPKWGGGPPPGTSLTTVPPAVDRGAPGPGFGIGGGSWDPRNWFRANPNATFAPGEQLNLPGGPAEGGNFPGITGFGKAGLWGAGGAAMGKIIEPQPAETGELSPRFFTGQGVQPGLSAPQGTPYEVPRGMPGRAVDAPQTYPHMPWPDTGAQPGVGSAAPASPPPRPAAVPGGAVARQRPNLGTYAAPPPVVPGSPFTTLDYRPNSGPNERNRGSPVATALDLSRLFGGGQPAPAAAAPAAVPYPPPRPQPVSNQPVYKQSNIPVATPGPTDPSIVARQKMRRFKGSSSSQGGGQ